MAPTPAYRQDAALTAARSRLVWVGLAFMLGYFAVCLRLVDLTLLRPAPGEEGAPPVVEIARVQRGDIVDRNGALVATSLRMSSVYADATLVEDAQALAASLAKILPGEKVADLKEKLSSGKKFSWISRDVTPQQVWAINALGNPALNFQEEVRRIYPDGPLAAHVTGYTDLDGGGISGVEKQFEGRLSKGGHPLRLTLDMRLQHIVRAEVQAGMKDFGAKAGVGVIMDANSGEILSLVSLPDFDPHHPGEADADSRFNRDTLGVYEMGSTFKLFSTAAALESGKARFSSVFDAAEPIKFGRFTISDYHAKKRALTVPEIFIYSSNIGTARMAHTVGTEGMQSFYRSLGFFEPAPLSLPETASPLYPRPWREIDTLTTSFGHGIAVTPVHVARAAAALVNGGTLITPRLVLEAGDPPSQRPQGPRVVSPQVSEMLRKLMSLTVTAGTGGKAAVAGYDVGGKTGTAEKNQNGHYVRDKVMSSFLAAFPMRDPKYIVLVTMDEPQPRPEAHGFVTGGWTAAPAVSRIIARMAPLYGMPPGGDDGLGIKREMATYVRDLREDKNLASAGADH